MSLELVLLVPVLVLLTVFVLWAGRGGRAALTADLAAEEAATAAALCCEEDRERGKRGARRWSRTCSTRGPGWASCVSAGLGPMLGTAPTSS